VTGRKALIALPGAAAVAAAPALAVAATKGKTRTVTVNDNYYGPSDKLTVHVGDTIKWHWTQEATDVHDVALKTGPKGARKFASDAMAAGDDFKQKLTRAGTYKIICTFHETDMKMTITVKKLPVKK
jgi:plastocyanin